MHRSDDRLCTRVSDYVAMLNEHGLRCGIEVSSSHSDWQTRMLVLDNDTHGVSAALATELALASGEMHVRLAAYTSLGLTRDAAAPVLACAPAFATA